ncbi:transporter substrate-binding domain-containing protein [Aeromonas veronii]|uniref:substrate-binding periplasmic protein n=1 Tax=Aeromonas veronii TaxID=654 RepID=UPI00226C6DBD|nr:transporter substrate-binding domain-containing protein [Aeromonas veronii]MCX9134859.1 transporter substrate-binding domain-containing protein [Aeromonas veronii]
MRNKVQLITHVLLLLSLLMSTELYAKQLRVGVSFSMPPYIIDQGPRGIELDLIRSAFAGTTYEIVFEYLPVARTFRQFESGKLDAIINVTPGMVDPALLSAPVLIFHNRVFTLNDTHINTLDDLLPLRVVAFQRATDFLGGEFAAMANNNPRYTETAKQQAQVSLLLVGRVDAIVLDELIFQYFWAQAQNDVRLKEAFRTAKIRQADLFPPTYCHFAFHSADARTLFDRQLEAMRKDGRYQQIFAAYGVTPRDP